MTPLRPIHLIVDFDGTLTRKDTLAILAQVGYTHHKQRHQQHSNTSAAPLQSWAEIVAAYTADFNMHLTAYHPAKA